MDGKKSVPVGFHDVAMFVQYYRVVHGWGQGKRIGVDVGSEYKFSSSIGTLIFCCDVKDLDNGGTP